MTAMGKQTTQRQRKIKLPRKLKSPIIPKASQATIIRTIIKTISIIIAVITIIAVIVVIVIKISTQAAISTITILTAAIKAMITEADRTADIITVTETISTGRGILQEELTEDSSRHTAILSITDSRDTAITIRPMQDFMLL